MSTNPLFMLLDGQFADDFCLETFHHSRQELNVPPEADPVARLSGYLLFDVDAVIKTLQAKSKSIVVENKVWNLQDGETCVLYSTSRTANMIAYRLSEQDFEFINSLQVAI